MVLGGRVGGLTVSRSVTDERLIRTIRQGRAQIDAILTELADEAASSKAALGPFFAYSRPDFIAAIGKAGAANAQLHLIEPHSISERAIRFVFGGYLHATTECTFRLRTRNENTEIVRGSVTMCTLVSNTLHEVEAAFIKPLDIALYCADATVCKVLVVDDDDSGRQLVKHYLTGLNTKVDEAATGEAGVDAAMRETYDLILMDLELPSMSGQSAMLKLRENGYTGPIASFSAESNGDALTQLLNEGFDSHVAKPFSSEDIANAVAAVRSDPLLSEFEDVEGMVDLIQGFAADLPERVRSVQAAVGANDDKELLRAIRPLLENGGSFGFPDITTAAAAVEESIRAQSAHHPVGKLISTLRRVRVRSLSGSSSP